MKIFECRYLIAGLTVAQAVAALNRNIQTSLSPDYECTHPPYTIHFLSHDPVVVYIANFLTAAEREHLLQTRYVTHSGSFLPSLANL